MNKSWFSEQWSQISLIVSPSFGMRLKLVYTNFAYQFWFMVDIHITDQRDRSWEALVHSIQLRLVIGYVFKSNDAHFNFASRNKTVASVSWFQRSKRVLFKIGKKFSKANQWFFQQINIVNQSKHIVYKTIDQLRHIWNKWRCTAISCGSNGLYEKPNS